jgi:hypothetical protein
VGRTQAERRWQASQLNIKPSAAAFPGSCAQVHNQSKRVTCNWSPGLGASVKVVRSEVSGRMWLLGEKWSSNMGYLLCHWFVPDRGGCVLLVGSHNREMN